MCFSCYRQRRKKDNGKQDDHETIWFRRDTYNYVHLWIKFSKCQINCDQPLPNDIKRVRRRNEVIALRQTIKASIIITDHEQNEQSNSCDSKSCSESNRSMRARRLVQSSCNSHLQYISTRERSCMHVVQITWWEGGDNWVWLRHTDCPMQTQPLQKPQKTTHNIHAHKPPTK